jgi:DNA mismatch repair ATPase MutS
MNLLTPKDLVVNDLVFDDDHTIYILTGANRGGKTTATQGIGLLYALAQGGVYVPAAFFEFAPADCIYTHFPADEDQTMDLGRLGEECIRFKEIFENAKDTSLILMNETFSTTSFEEGYYIACDSIKALLTKGARTIYNTHMHKLGLDAEEFSKDFKQKASSLIVKSDGGKRSFKLAIAPPEGSSYAADIAKKYGVTYEMLTGNKE